MTADDASLLKTLSNVADFFTTDDCGDLLFHVREHRMSLPEIKSFIVANDLEFVGFALEAATRGLFAARFPDPAALTDLDCWHAFETGRPQTFAGIISSACASARRGRTELEGSSLAWLNAPA